MKTYKKKMKLVKNKKITSVSYTLNKNQAYFIELYAQLFLDEVCFKFNKQRLESLIDNAIDHQDKHSFNQLSNTYLELLKVSN